MVEGLGKSAQKIQSVFENLGLSFSIVSFPESTHTAREAADAIGCTLGQIAKSLVFRRLSGEPLLVIASGTNRVNEKALAALIGEKIEKANADYVLEKTGFAIGGVPPVGHTDKIETLIDEDLMLCDEIWAAAGTEHAVFCLKPAELLQLTGGGVVPIK